MGPDDQRRLRRTRKPGLRVVVSNARGLPVPDDGLGRWLRRVAPARARGTVGIVFAADARVRRLNREYRGHDHATDVLSFPSGGGHGRVRDDVHLGDVVIARGVARRQAREAGHSPRTEMRVLALHGLLHLLGYDHEDGSPAMARLERRLRLKGGLREGLIERSAP